MTFQRKDLSGRDNCALREADSGYGSLCEHRLSSPEPIPSSVATNYRLARFKCLRWLLKEKNHQTMSLRICLLDKTNLGFPISSGP